MTMIGEPGMEPATFTAGGQEFQALNPAVTISALINSVRRSTRTVRNRLHSIKEDSDFVLAAAQAYNLPLVTNARAGDWYVDPRVKAGGVYFKSTDGHVGEWGFSRRRLNLGLLDVAGRDGGRGAVIVDSTRRGKRFPDALSKTIPIWVAILNKALYSSAELTLHTTPLAVSPSEHSQIEARLPQLYSDFIALGLDLTPLRQNLHGKHLRPLFITPSSTLPTTPPAFEEFTPLVLTTASRILQGSGMEGEYIQGAGDDHEGWASATGLTPSIFWQHHKQLLQIPTEDELLEAIITIIATSDPSTEEAKATLIAPTTTLYLGSSILLKPSTTSSTSSHFDIILNCSAEQPTESQEPIDPNPPAESTSPKQQSGPKSIPFPIHPKKGSNKTLRLGWPSIQSQLEPYILSGKRIAVVCKTGDEVSPAVALVLLCYYYAENGQVEKQNPTTIDKALVKRRLAWISASRPSANPPRTLLNAVNSVLMERR